MNHKRYPLAYLFEVAMPLNLVVTRDEDPGPVSSTKYESKSDWVMEFSAGNKRTVTVNYFHRQKKPFEFQCKGFDDHPYYECNDHQMVAIKMATLWEAVQLLRVIDSVANGKVRRAV